MVFRWAMYVVVFVVSVFASTDVPTFKPDDEVVITGGEHRGKMGYVNEIHEDGNRVSIDDAKDASELSNIHVDDVRHIAKDHGEKMYDMDGAEELIYSSGADEEGSLERGAKVGVTLHEDPPKNVIGEVTSIEGDTVTVKVIEGGKTVVRLKRNVWILPATKLEELGGEVEGGREEVEEDRNDMVSVECRDGSTEVTNVQYEYLTKTFSDGSMKTMTVAQLEAFVDVQEEDGEIDVSDKIPEGLNGEALGDIAEDNYMAPYFKDTGGGLTYFDLDRLGISPSDLMRMREKQKMEKALQGDFAGAEAVGELSAADLVLAEKRKEIEIRIEEKKLETKQTCTFQCKKKLGKFDRLRGKGSSAECYKEEFETKLDDLNKKKNRAQGVKELTDAGWRNVGKMFQRKESIDLEILDYRNALDEYAAGQNWKEQRREKIVEKLASDTNRGIKALTKAGYALVNESPSQFSRPQKGLVTYKEAITEHILRDPVTIEVACDPPDPTKIPMGAQWVEGACETQACSERAIEACKKEETLCDSDASGSPDSLLGPLRSCPFRCQNYRGMLNGNSECRVRVGGGEGDVSESEVPEDTDRGHEANAEMVPVYANMTCASCMAETCISGVPAECEREIERVVSSGRLGALGALGVCDVSKSDKIEYLTSWSEIEKRKELAIKPDAYKRCTFECKMKARFGQTKTCVRGATKEPIYASVKCDRCGTSECATQVQELCMKRDERQCNAEIGMKYSNYLVESDTEMVCTYECKKRGKIGMRKDCVLAAKEDAEDPTDATTMEDESAPGSILTVPVTCFDCASSECKEMVAPACKNAAEGTCDAVSAKSSDLVSEAPKMVPLDGAAEEEDQKMAIEGTKSADQDTTSDVPESDFEGDGQFAKKMPVVETDEERAKVAAQRELEGRIAFDRWMHFAKVKSGCETFPYCNHVPSPPPFLPAPLDLAAPRANVKYPFVPPLRAGAPFKVEWDTSKTPMTYDMFPPGSATPTGEAPRKLGMADGTRPKGIPGMTLATHGGHMFDDGYKPTEFEEKPFQKAGVGGWSYHFNLYRPSLGNLEESPAPDLRGETPDTAYPNWLDPEKTEENWNMLGANGDATFDVFDRLTQKVVKGSFPSDPELSVTENTVGDIPSAPLTEEQRHESFLGSPRAIPGQKAPLTWDTDMFDSKALEPPSAEAVRYLKTEGIEPDCESIEDPAHQAACRVRQKQAEERFRSRSGRFRRRRRNRV